MTGLSSHVTASRVAAKEVLIGVIPGQKKAQRFLAELFLDSTSFYQNS